MTDKLIEYLHALERLVDIWQDWLQSCIATMDQQLGLAGRGFKPGWWQVPRLAPGVAIYGLSHTQGLEIGTIPNSSRTPESRPICLCRSPDKILTSEVNVCARSGQFSK